MQQRHSFPCYCFICFVLTSLSALFLFWASCVQDIRAVVAQLRADRQTVMFSATWPPAIQTLAMEFMTKPVKVNMKHYLFEKSRSRIDTLRIRH